jgi:hypothetical protein
VATGGCTPEETSLSPTERMIALMNHFGLGAEYFGGLADKSLTGRWMRGLSISCAFRHW